MLNKENEIDKIQYELDDTEKELNAINSKIEKRVAQLEVLKNKLKLGRNKTNNRNGGVSKTKKGKTENTAKLDKKKETLSDVVIEIIKKNGPLTEAEIEYFLEDAGNSYSKDQVINAIKCLKRTNRINKIMVEDSIFYSSIPFNSTPWTEIIKTVQKFQPATMEMIWDGLERQDHYAPERFLAAIECLEDEGFLITTEHSDEIWYSMSEKAT